VSEILSGGAFLWTTHRARILLLLPACNCSVGSSCIDMIEVGDVEDWRTALARRPLRRIRWIPRRWWRSYLQCS